MVGVQMAVTLKQIESLPSGYPDLGAPDPLSPAAMALDHDSLWQRLESYVVHRWTPRDVVWIVEGCGEWYPPLVPATITTVEVWSAADAWEAVELPPAPLGGYWLTATGPFRFSGTVGLPSPNDAPAAVCEAFRRLAEYVAATTDLKSGVTRRQIGIGGEITQAVSRDPAWLARAMQLSGAADLLRPYRRA